MNKNIAKAVEWILAGIGIAVIILFFILLLTSCATYTDADRFRHGVEVYQSHQDGIYEINQNK